MKAPAFQFYAADYLADESVQLMTLEEEGVYVRLLAYCWREGSIPADPISLSRLCKGADSSAISRPLACFIPHRKDAARLVHPRLEQERKKQDDFRQKCRAGGKKGASHRWKTGDGVTHGQAIARPLGEPMGNDGSSSSSSSSSSSISSSSEYNITHTHSAREEEPGGGVPGQIPTFAQFAQECAKYQVPEWYARRRFDDFTVKGWMSGKTPIVWRDAVKSWVVRDHHREGRPLHPPKSVKPPASISTSRAVQPRHDPTDDKL